MHEPRDTATTGRDLRDAVGEGRLSARLPRHLRDSDRGARWPGGAFSAAPEPSHHAEAGSAPRCARIWSFVYHPDRLQTPLRRVGPKGSRRPLGADDVGRRHWRDRGPLASRSSPATAPRPSCPTPTAARSACVQLGIVQRTACGTAWAPADSSAPSAARRRTRPCTQPMARAGRLTIPMCWRAASSSSGATIPPRPAPHFLPHLREAQRRGAYVVVIDPRRTLTARSANEHLQPRPATDGALALGLLHVLFAEGLHDEPWLEAHTIGWRDLRDRVASYPPERVAEITGIPAETIVALARRMGRRNRRCSSLPMGCSGMATAARRCARSSACQRWSGQVGVRGGGLSY